MHASTTRAAIYCNALPVLAIRLLRRVPCVRMRSSNARERLTKNHKHKTVNPKILGKKHKHNTQRDVHTTQHIHKHKHTHTHTHKAHATTTARLCSRCSTITHTTLPTCRWSTSSDSGVAPDSTRIPCGLCPTCSM